MKVGEYEIAEFKAVSDGPKRGLFAALVSVFGNIDRTGDRVMPGAFTKSIDRWKTSGQPIPVIWSHGHKSLDDYIGSVNPIDVKETAAGLVVAGKLDIEENPKAAKIYSLLERGLVKAWSFAYEVKEESIAKDLARELHEVDIFEVGPTLIGANSEARTLALKEAPELESGPGPEVPAEEPEQIEAKDVEPALAATTTVTTTTSWDPAIEQKIGRVISAKTETRLRNIQQELNDILAQVGEDTAAQEAQTPGGKALSGEQESLRLGIEEAGVFLAERK